MTQAVDPTGTYGFTFDNLGRLTGTSTQYSFLTGRTLTESYGYDAASNRTSFTDPENGVTNYTYDTLNRLSTLKDFSNGSSGFSYDALSRRTALTRPNGVTTSYSYDTLSRLLQALHQKGSTLVESAGYAYDAAGNRTSKTETTPGKHGNSTRTDTFSYDAIYELTQAATNGSTTDNDTYDAVGNRLTDVFGGTYTYNNSNELTAYPAYSWTYDNNGNTASKTVSGSTTTYNWDFENRLTSVVLPGTGGTVTFKYDPFGRRIYKSSSSGTTIFAYDGDNMVEQLNSSGTATARYTQGLGIDEPLEVYEGGKSYYYHADGLGSIVALTKSTGTTANTYFGYNTFGGMPSPSETVSNPFRFTARDYDSETGLYYYRARYYDSLFGRFLSEDPARWPGGGPNFYRYALGNPVNLRDTSGLEIVVDGDVRSYASALAYLRMSPSMARITNDLIGSPEIYTIKTNDRCDDSFEPATMTINWDPHCGLICTPGGHQSAALGLGHEMAHADGGGFAGAFMRLLPDFLLKLFPNGPYDNFEERRVVTGPETQAAHELGAGVRTDHRGADNPGLPTPTSR